MHRRVLLGFRPNKTDTSGCEYAEGFREHFERAVRRRLRSAFPVAVSVSGGLDSSSIFCLAHSLRRGGAVACPEVVGISYTPADGSPADENEFVLAIERECGVGIERVPIGDPGMMDGCFQEAWHVEAPLLDGQWNSTADFMDAMHHHKARVLLTGHWGDQLLFDFAYLQDLFRNFAWLEIYRHLKEFARWNTDVEPSFFRRGFTRGLLRSFLPRPLSRIAKRARNRLFPGSMPGHWYSERLHQLARSLTRRPPPAPLSATAHGLSLYHEARSASCALHGVEQQGGCHAPGKRAFPFLDRDLVGFLMAIPGDARMHQGVSKALLRQGMRGFVPDSLGRRWRAIRASLQRPNRGVHLRDLQVARSRLSSSW